MSANPVTLPTKTKMKVTYAPKDKPNYIPGRRGFFKYRDLGITEATHGRIRAQITSAEKGMSEPTGWHYHQCETQIVYVLKGWVDLEFEEEGKIRVSAGDSLMIPGGAKHNETATSDELELLEVSLPADMGTVNCEAPR
jgi:mannose-6-phosphate isomerase-like protein (cupin superfamily)